MAKGDYTDNTTKARYKALVKKPSSTPTKVTVASDELRTRAEILDMVEELFESEKDVGGANELNPQIDNESLRAFLHMLAKNVVNTSDDGAGITTSQVSAITANTAKTTFPGFGTSGTTALAGDTSLLALGTSSSTALAGDTTTISTAQANEITANTAKVSQNLRTANHTMQFDVVNSRGTYTLVITIIDGTNAKAPVTKTVALALK